jgi:hypothetical protein
MALLDINLHFARLIIEFDTEHPFDLLMHGQVVVRINDAQGKFIFRECPTQYIQFEDGTKLMSAIAAERMMQELMPSYGIAQIGYLIDGVFRHVEEIRFSNRLMNMGYEPLRLSRHCRPFTEKGAKVAVFTQAFNEGDMLLYWERFYGELVGYENLYVLNNGSTDGSCERLNPKTNVINMPPVRVDHFEFAHSHSYFQRFLLMRYEWVIKVDTDELMSIEGGLMATLKRLAPGTYFPELALEPVHDRDGEAPFRFDGKLAGQRKHYVVGTEGLIRPLISSVPTSWTAGNHLCLEPTRVLPGFVIVHLKYFDYDFLLEKNIKWAQMKATERETNTCKQISILNALDQQQIERYTIDELAERFDMERATLPSWFDGSV